MVIVFNKQLLLVVDKGQSILCIENTTNLIYGILNFFFFFYSEHEEDLDEEVSYSFMINSCLVLANYIDL